MQSVSNWKKNKKLVFCGSLHIKQARNERCISERSRNTADFVTRVVPIPTENEFLRVVGEGRRCSALKWFLTYMTVMMVLIFVTMYTVFGFPSHSSNSADSLSSRNILCHLLIVVTPKTLLPNIFRSNKIVSALFFFKHMQNLIAARRI